MGHILVSNPPNLLFPLPPQHPIRHQDIRLKQNCCFPFHCTFVHTHTHTQELTDAMVIDFQETSAKENINMKETFLGLVQSIMDSGEVGKTMTHSNIITITPLNRKKQKYKKMLHNIMNSIITLFLCV